MISSRTAGHTASLFCTHLLGYRLFGFELVGALRLDGGVTSAFHRGIGVIR